MVIAAEIDIRDAAEADLDAIQRIYNHAILTTVATWDEEPWSMEKRREWWFAHDQLQPIIVAERAGEVVGFAALTQMNTKRGWRFTRENTIYIDEAWRGHGIGHALLAALLERARALGLRLVVASITTENEASLALHRAHGFEVVGTLRNAGYKFERWLNTTYMQLDLG